MDVDRKKPRQINFLVQLLLSFFKDTTLGHVEYNLENTPVVEIVAYFCWNYALPLSEVGPTFDRTTSYFCWNYVLLSLIVLLSHRNAQIKVQSHHLSFVGR